MQKRKAKEFTVEIHDEADPQRTIEVQIFVDSATGSVVVSKNTVVAVEGQEIRFTCEAGAWSVIFHGQTPLQGKHRLKGQAGDSDGAPAGSALGRFKYTVAAVGQDGIPYAVDPDIIIKPMGVDTGDF